MFKSRKSAGGGGMSGLQSKLAHTTILPVLGNQDLKLLQDLITAEKSVVITLQKLANDYTKAAEALKAWGQGEGDDLGDVLSHSAGMLLHFSGALVQYAVHGQSMRVHLKNIRTREEELDELKKRRRNVGSKADSAEKKLSKMGVENKGLQDQKDLLTRLREEMSYLDSEILSEESRLSDYKRQMSKDILALKFGGLMECAEKATVVGELGNLIIQEIPLETTLPGNPRAYYSSYEKTSKLASEASRCVGEVSFAPPTSVPLPPGSQPAPISEPNTPVPPSKPIHNQASTFSGYPQQSDYVSNPYPNEFGESRRSSNPSAQPYPSETYAGQGATPLANPYEPMQNPNGQFATFPSAAARRGTIDAEPPHSLQTLHGQPDPSFAESVADALAADSYLRENNTPNIEASAIDVPPTPVPQDVKAANPWNEPGVEAQPPTSKPRHSRSLVAGEDDGSDLPYATGPTAAGRGKKSSVEFNYPYEDNAFYVRNHATSSVPLSPTESSKRSVEIAHPPEPPSPAYHEHDEAAANAAAAREVGRELDALAFQSHNIEHGGAVPPPTNDTQTTTYAPPPGPPPLTAIIRSRPGTPVSAVATGGAPIPQSYVPSNAPPLAYAAPRPVRQNSSPLVPPAPLGGISVPSSPVTASGPLGTRTISASAFRRQASKSPGIPPDGPTNVAPLPDLPSGATNPLQVRKRPGIGSPVPPAGPRIVSTSSLIDRSGVPVSPGASGYYTPNEGPEPAYPNPSGQTYPSDKADNLPPRYSQSGPHGQQVPQQQQPPATDRLADLIPDEEEFMRELERDDPTQHSPHAHRRAGGYETGHFSTNLE